MNTPSNAGKEHNPWDRKPHEYGAPEWRLLNTDEAVQIGDEYNCKDYRCEPRWAAVEHTGYMPISHTEYRRRATPPTQSQEGETVDYSAPTPETDAFMTLIDDSEIDLGQVETKLKQFECERNAAQRENDRLRSEVEGLKADRERLDWLENPLRFTLEQSVELRVLNPDDKGNYFEFSIREVMPLDEFYACLTLRSAIDAARAATEEGK